MAFCYLLITQRLYREYKEYHGSIAGDQRLICCNGATDHPYYYYIFNCDNKFRLISIVITLGCKINWIEENAVIESSLQLMVLIIGSGSGIKCWRLSTTLSHRMQYGTTSWSYGWGFLMTEIWYWLYYDIMFCWFCRYYLGVRFQECVLKCCNGREFIPFDGNMVINVSLVDTSVCPLGKASHTLKEVVTFSLWFLLLEIILFRVLGPKPWHAFGNLSHRCVIYIGNGMVCLLFPQ